MAGARARITLAEETRTRPDQREVHVKKDRLSVCHRTDYRIRVYTITMRDWKDTLNLPRTDFPMKANLPTSEPATIARWDAMNLYGKLREVRRGAPRFV